MNRNKIWRSKNCQIKIILNYAISNFSNTTWYFIMSKEIGMAKSCQIKIYLLWTWHWEHLSIVFIEQKINHESWIIRIFNEIFWHVISLQLQHGGMSDGGGNIWASRCLPFFTMNAVAMPQVRWRSTWQCRNHTPATEKIYRHYT